MAEQAEQSRPQTPAGTGSEPQRDSDAATEQTQGKAAQLEQGLSLKDTEVAVLRDSLAGAVAKYRLAVLAAAPGVPEELVKGETVDEIDASLEAARSIVSRIRQDLEAEVAAKSIPAGAPPRSAHDTSALSPGEKIAHALARQAA
jgi:hypothetical protein